MDFSFDLVSFLIGAAVAGAACAFVLFGRRRDESLLLAQFKALAQDTLHASQESLLTLATERVKTLNAEATGEAEKRHKAFSDLVEPIKKGLTELDQRVVALDKAGAGLNEHLNIVAQGQRALQTETAQLVQALRSPNIRGRWGELQLQRALESVGMAEGRDFSTQVTRKSKDGTDIRPDFLLNLTEGRELVIDCKTPIEGYVDALREGISLAEQKEALKRHAKLLRGHVMEMSKKAYWREFSGAEFIILFVPGEGILSAALAEDHTLLEDASRARVMLASPTSIMSLLHLIQTAFKQQKVAEQAEQIAEAGRTLLDRLVTFNGYLEKLGRGLDSANSAYNDAMKSYGSRVLQGARKMEELGVRGKAALPADIKLVEQTRNIAANE